MKMIPLTTKTPAVVGAKSLEGEGRQVSVKSYLNRLRSEISPRKSRQLLSGLTVQLTESSLVLMNASSPSSLVSLSRLVRSVLPDYAPSSDFLSHPA